MKIRTKVHGGSSYMNHSATKLVIRSNVKSGSGYFNHNGVRVRSAVG